MTAKELKALADKYDKKHENAFRNYMETGISRYDREARNAEEIADACRQALSAADDHEYAALLRFKISEWAATARMLASAREDAISLLKDIIDFAVLQGLLRKED